MQGTAAVQEEGGRLSCKSAKVWVSIPPPTHKHCPQAQAPPDSHPPPPTHPPAQPPTIFRRSCIVWEMRPRLSAYSAYAPYWMAGSVRPLPMAKPCRLMGGTTSPLLLAWKTREATAGT